MRTVKTPVFPLTPAEKEHHAAALVNPIRRLAQQRAKVWHFKDVQEVESVAVAAIPKALNEFDRAALAGEINEDSVSIFVHRAVAADLENFRDSEQRRRNRMRLEPKNMKPKLTVPPLKSANVELGERFDPANLQPGDLVVHRRDYGQPELFRRVARFEGVTADGKTLLQFSDAQVYLDGQVELYAAIGSPLLSRWGGKLYAPTEWKKFEKTQVA